MLRQDIDQTRMFTCRIGLYIVVSFLVGSMSTLGQDLDSSIKAAQSRESGNAPSSSDSTHPENDVVKPSLNRNRRSNLFNEHLYGNSEGLNSAFLYNDEIMQNLLKSSPSKPLNYARSNFFLNYLKPRTTRYNAWDDHSLMHFGKRSLENEIVSNKENEITGDKILVKRSADFWSPNNVLHFGKKSTDLVNDGEVIQNTFDTAKDDFDTKVEVNTKDSDTSGTHIETDLQKANIKKSADPWHSMMSFGKKSQSPLDHNTLHFGKKDDNLYNEFNSNKRFENFWDHNTMHFGKRNDPWHNMMSFGKKSDPWHSMMSFGKKSDNFWDHNTMHFGKKDEPWHNIMSFGKRFETPWDHNNLHFGKRDPWDHSTLHFGKRDPWDHNTLHFGKRSPWDHNTLHFGKRNPWDQNMLHFGKKDDPWQNMMSFGKRSDNLWDHNTLHFGKKSDPWHSMMSFGKKSENSDMTDLEKREDPWHNMMSFGKKSENSDMTDLEKREDPWHNMMSFGKKSNGLWNSSITMEDKRDEPWHSMMSFGKRFDYNFDHNTLHFGKREEPWHNMMSFGKKSGNPWDHSTLHFGKRNEPWHSMMSFGKKSENFWDHNTLPFGKKDEPWHSMMSFGKKSDGLIDDLSEDFARNFDPWYDYDGMIFYKKSNPWDHSTLHFGKKSNMTLKLSPPTEKINSNHIQKRSTDMWNDHHTMHFGKKFDPWESHNTMHFGKKSNSLQNDNTEYFENKEEYDSLNDINMNKKFDWDSHNTMHFGKRDPEDYRNTFVFDKRDPWDYHNTMHFGKRDPLDFHNTMHFGKRSDPNLKDSNIFSTDKHKEQTELKNSGNGDTRKLLDNTNNKNELNIRKRSSVIVKTNDRSKLETMIKEIPNQASDNRNFLFQSEAIKHPNIKSTFEITKTVQNEKKNVDNSITSSKSKEKNQKLSLSENSSMQDHSKSDEIREMSHKKSHVKKRSVEPNSFMTAINKNTNANTDSDDKYPEDDIADSVLHFGKRSVKVLNDNEGQWYDDKNEKRFDDFWNNYNTLHFGKKSDPWDNHNTLHFGKKSNPQGIDSVMPFTKKDPWEHINTLHFGKKFDPWDGHAKMHFGKRTDNWDHNVMHFGKKSKLTSNDLLVPSSLEELDPVAIDDYIQSINEGQDYSAENNDVLDNLVILKSIINSRLKDDSIPFEEKVSVLKQYLKPILRAIINDEGSDFNSFSQPNNNFNERTKSYYDGAEGMRGKSIIMPFKTLNEIGYDENIFKNGNDDSSYGEYGDNAEQGDNLIEIENLNKSKRKYLGKAELKRYFTPFQGPKSIVYPHAWFASQIRRSSLPRTTDYARHVEMRMAEKKEDPFNTYMHFG